MGVAACPACEGEQQQGMLVLDPVGSPSWRLDCSRCVRCAAMLLIAWGPRPLLPAPRRHRHTFAMLASVLPMLDPRCSFLIVLPKNLHSAKVAADSCEVGLTAVDVGCRAGMRRKGLGHCMCQVLRPQPAQPAPCLQECGAQLLDVDWKKGHSPLAGGATQ